MGADASEWVREHASKPGLRPCGRTRLRQPHGSLSFTRFPKRGWRLPTFISAICSVSSLILVSASSARRQAHSICLLESSVCEYRMDFACWGPEQCQVPTHHSNEKLAPPISLAALFHHLQPTLKPQYQPRQHPWPPRPQMPYPTHVLRTGPRPRLAVCQLRHSPPAPVARARQAGEHHGGCCRQNGPQTTSNSAASWQCDLYHKMSSSQQLLRQRRHSTRV